MKTFASTAAIRAALAPVIAAALLAIPHAASAESIGASFVPTSSSQLLPPGTSAGVVPQTNWMNITSTPITSLALTDNSGAATGATLSLSGFAVGFGWYNSGAALGDEWLMGTNFAASGPLTLTFASIPYASYDVILYNLPLFIGISYTYTLGATSYYGSSPSASSTSAGYVDGNAGTPFNFTRAVSTNSGSPTANSTYARFEGLSGGSQTITMSGGNGIAYINGFQIVANVPEPAGAAFLVLGAMTLLGRRRRIAG